MNNDDEPKKDPYKLVRANFIASLYHSIPIGSSEFLYRITLQMFEHRISEDPAMTAELRIRKNIAKQLNTYFLDYLRYRIDDSFRAIGHLEPRTVLVSSSYRFDGFIDRYELMIELADMVLPQTPGSDQC